MKRIGDIARIDSVEWNPSDRRRRPEASQWMLRHYHVEEFTKQCRDERHCQQGHAGVDDVTMLWAVG